MLAMSLEDDILACIYMYIYIYIYYFICFAPTPPHQDSISNNYHHLILFGGGETDKSFFIFQSFHHLVSRFRFGRNKSNGYNEKRKAFNRHYFISSFIIIIHHYHPEKERLVSFFLLFRCLPSLLFDPSIYLSYAYTHTPFYSFIIILPIVERLFYYIFSYYYFFLSFSSPFFHLLFAITFYAILYIFIILYYYYFMFAIRFLFFLSHHSSSPPFFFFFLFSFLVEINVLKKRSPAQSQKILYAKKKKEL